MNASGIALRRQRVHVDGVQVAGVHGARDLQLRGDTDVHPRSDCPSIMVIGVSHGISSPKGTACTAPAFGWKAPPSRALVNSISCLYSWSPLSRLDLGLGARPTAPSISWSTEPPGSAPPPWTTPPRYDVGLDRLGLHRSPTGPQAREQLLERHVCPSPGLRVNPRSYNAIRP